MIDRTIVFIVILLDKSTRHKHNPSERMHVREEGREGGTEQESFLRGRNFYDVAQCSVAHSLCHQTSLLLRCTATAAAAAAWPFYEISPSDGRGRKEGEREGVPSAAALIPRHATQFRAKL